MLFGAAGTCDPITRPSWESRSRFLRGAVDSGVAFQSVIVSEPGAVQRILRTIAERMKLILSDPAMDIDTDEANAAHVQTGAQGFIEGIQSEG